MTTSYNFAYTGSYTSFSLTPGVYSFILAGSNGESDTGRGGTVGGNGAVVSAMLNLKAKTTFYAYVGGRTTFNGGGKGQFPSGSASDVRLVSGSWNNFESLKSRVIVAGGGGGNDSGDVGGAGGLNGHSSAKNHGEGGTQTSGGYGLSRGGFGYGGQINANTGGGGGGYFGGGSSDNQADYGGGGGSSFISGYKGCNAISKSSTSSNIKPSGSPFHYSGIKFHNVIVEDGANAGTGYIRIQFLYYLTSENTCRCNKNLYRNIPFVYIFLLYSI